MNLKLSEEINEIINYSKEDAIRLGNNALTTDHLFLGILRQGKSDVLRMLLEFGVDLKEQKTYIENYFIAKEPLSEEMAKSMFLTKAADKALRQTYLEARAMKEDEPKAIHLFLSILCDKNALITQSLQDLNISYEGIKSELKGDNSFQASTPNEEEEEEEDNMFSKTREPIRNSASSTPVIDNFSVDLTKAALEKRLDPVVGRDKEIERMTQILSRRKKNNPVLIGDPGVGKSAIVEGLALRIAHKKVPHVLQNKRVVSLDLAAIVAGTKYRGQFEERIKAILNELSKNSHIILFIDEIHTMVGAGGATGSLDAANMLKPALARGELQCIGATTLDEYREHIEKDGALERRFQKILIDPTSPEETLDILRSIKTKYEEHHHVEYTEDALKACVSLTVRYVSDRALPDKAIDALDEAGARVHISSVDVPQSITKIEKKIEEIRFEKLSAVKLQDFEKAAELRNVEKNLQDDLVREQKNWSAELEQNRQSVDEEKVAEVVAMMTNVPVQRIAQKESSRLIEMPTILKGSVIGQDNAVEKVAKAIQRNRAGLKDPNKPIGTFIFMGPTGIGKTQLAKVLAQYLFDSTDNLIRIDMSEYMEKFAVSRLIGAPPGYVGYEEGGQLTEKVRRRPYSVLLFDEIEKAHPDVFHVLLQLLDEGQLTDGLGRKVDFKNTIIIMTSNIGSRDLKEFGQGIGFSTTTKRDEVINNNAKTYIDKALKRTFAPEFLNRIDDIILFNSLNKEDIYKIIDIELVSLFKRINELGYQIELTEKAKNFIAEEGYDPQFGARPLKRSIQKNLEDILAEVIILNKPKVDSVLVVDFDEEKKETFAFLKKKNEKGKASTKKKNN